MNITEQDLIDAYASGRADEAEETAALITRLKKDRVELMATLNHLVVYRNDRAFDAARDALNRVQKPLGDEA
jgi:hypothetical protein